MAIPVLFRRGCGGYLHSSYSMVTCCSPCASLFPNESELRATAMILYRRSWKSGIVSAEVSVRPMTVRRCGGVSGSTEAPPSLVHSAKPVLNPKKAKLSAGWGHANTDQQPICQPEEQEANLTPRRLGSLRHAVLSVYINYLTVTWKRKQATSLVALTSTVSIVYEHIAPAALIRSLFYRPRDAFIYG